MRKKLIIENLSESKSISLKDLVGKLKVSDRTIRNEIKEINNDGMQKGFRILNIRGKGYILEVDDREKFSKYNENLIIGSGDGLLREDRINKIIEIILTNKGYTTIDDIAEKLMYSRSTVIKDLDEVQSILDELNIKLEKRSGFGIKVNGSEIEIRKAFSNYLYRHNTNITISNHKYKELFFEIKEVFLKEVIKNKVDISNLAIENIFNHLQILILRLESCNYIKEDTSNKEIIQGIESYNTFKEIANKIFNLIGKELELEIPSIEIDYLAAQILYKSKMFTQSDIVKTKVKKDIEEILDEIDKKSYTSFSSDYELVNNLLMHLCALISRARSDTQLKNPYFDEVNMRYSAVVSIAVNFTNEFSRRWDMKIEKDEIAFIAIHFVAHFEKSRNRELGNLPKIAIVCPTEGGMAYLLKLKLEKEFKDTVISTYTGIQIDEVIKNNYDYIITKIPIEDELRGKIFKLENLFDDNEIDRVCGEIKECLSGENIEIEETLKKIFFKRLKGGKSVDYKEIIKSEIDQLILNDYVDKNFYELVLEREKSLSTAYKNGVAGPHAMEMNAKENVLSIVVFDEDIRWGDKDINIVCLIAMKKGSLNLHKTIGSNLFKVINQKELRDKIRACQSKNDFLRIFK